MFFLVELFLQFLPFRPEEIPNFVFRRNILQNSIYMPHPTIRIYDNIACVTYPDNLVILTSNHILYFSRVSLQIL